MNKQKWNEMSQARKTAVVVMGVVEVALTTVALVDLVRRPADQVRGPKIAWVLACLVQPIGPITYLSAGRLPVPVEPAELPAEL
jgi:hypothetical protein